MVDVPSHKKKKAVRMRTAFVVSDHTATGAFIGG